MPERIAEVSMAKEISIVHQPTGVPT